MDHPGARGVGPMMVTMLIKNTLCSAYRRGGEGAGIESMVWDAATVRGH
jgi:hypothetical protein